MNTDFYENLPLVDRFTHVANPRNYSPVPEDWWVVITDVKGSTKAIEQGRYKEVNMVGASSIAAMLHVAEQIEVPFVFGGDGATFVIPDSLVAPAKKALAGARDRAREVFGMELRVGFVPVRELYAAGGRILASRFKISEHYHQAMFIGGGLTLAEKLVKDPEKGRLYLLPEAHESHADFHGLSCRWRDVASPYGETISLLVKALEPTDEGCDNVYRAVIEKVEEIYGDADMHHPISLDKLMISLASRVAEQETRLQALHRGRIFQTLMRIKLRLLLIGALFVDMLKIPLPGLDFQKYKSTLRATSDYKKFDDVLRMVISGTAEQREMLELFLNELHRRGELKYGLHVSDRALMTCLVFERAGRQVHFVDGADGGYAIASKQLKAQLAGDAEFNAY